MAHYFKEVVGNSYDIYAQDSQVLEYFKDICDADEHQLNLVDFFKRVCRSIANNGTIRTSNIYDLDVNILEKIL